MRIMSDELDEWSYQQETAWKNVISMRSGGGRPDTIKRSEMTRMDMDLKVIDDRPYLMRRICHGIPERCFWYRGHPLPLCARCTLFYPSLIITIPIGILVAVLLSPPAFSMLLFTTLTISPLVIDGLTQYHGLRSSTNMIRAVTGALAGIGSGIAAPYVMMRLAGALLGM